MKVDAPETAGKWRVCKHPGEAVNQGGSFLTIPKGAKDPKKSFELISFILNAKNQAVEYTFSGNFPAAPEAHSMPEVDGAVEFLGGQKAAGGFRAAENTAPPQKPFARCMKTRTPNRSSHRSLQSSNKSNRLARTLKRRGTTRSRPLSASPNRLASR